LRSPQRKEAKVEALEKLKFFQGREESAEALEEQRQPSDRQTKEIWTVEEFTSRRSSGEAYSRRRPTAVGSHSEIP
jgi:hypothetical protein